MPKYWEKMPGLTIQFVSQEHRWKKRGISIVPTRYKMDYFGGAKFPCTVVIYHHDGHVAVSHAGVEMGQGLNTKVLSYGKNKILNFLQNFI